MPAGAKRRCALHSSGGSFAPVAQRRRSNGQRAIVPGIISSRNPQEPCAACGSILPTPKIANGRANASPQARDAPSKIRHVAVIMVLGFLADAPLLALR